MQAAARVNEAADPDIFRIRRESDLWGKRAVFLLDRHVKIPIVFDSVCLVQPCAAEAEQCEGCKGREAF